ncbi:hypothetical protein DVH05_026245 [Phytophthora capsici]|nr:hypothetical protein DVH05_026245 [Phytophthora capsici]
MRSRNSLTETPRSSFSRGRTAIDRGLPTDMATGDFSQLPMNLCIGDAICCGEMLAKGSMNSVSDTVEKLTGRKPLHFQ